MSALKEDFLFRGHPGKHVGAVEDGLPHGRGTFTYGEGEHEGGAAEAHGPG